MVVVEDGRRQSDALGQKRVVSPKFYRDCNPQGMPCWPIRRASWARKGPGLTGVPVLTREVEKAHIRPRNKSSFPAACSILYELIKAQRPRAMRSGQLEAEKRPAVPGERDPGASHGGCRPACYRWFPRLRAYRGILAGGGDGVRQGQCRRCATGPPILLCGG